jgi:hypothetical protein
MLPVAQNLPLLKRWNGWFWGAEGAFATARFEVSNRACRVVSGSASPFYYSEEFNHSKKCLNGSGNSNSMSFA